jgi:tol-pal system protein YbgF
VHGHRPLTAIRDEGKGTAPPQGAAKPRSGERGGPTLSVARFIATSFLFATSFAHAALFDDNEARARIAEVDRRLAQTQKELEDRIAALESQIKSQGLVDLFNQVEQIRSDIARLRGQQEVLTYELEQAQKRQRDLYVDLDTRLRKLEGAPQASGEAPPPGGPVAGNAPPSSLPNVAPGGAPAPARPPSDPAVEQRAYDAALDQFKRGDYGGAIANFSGFVKNYPQSALAPSAQYWIGNAQYARKDYRASIAAQRLLITNYPTSSKVPDALLNVASAQSDLNDNAAARRTLEELIQKYPQSEAALKAKQRLDIR